MTTEKEVKQIIAKDMEAVNNTTFPGELPMWITQNFKEMIMDMPQRDNNYFARTVRSIADKGDRVGQLTVYETGFLLNVWTNVRPCVLGLDFDEFIRRKALIEPIMAGWNAMMRKKEEELARKENALLSALPKKAKLLTLQ